MRLSAGALLLISLTNPSVAQDWRDISASVRNRTVRAVIVSTIAAQSCDNVYLDKDSARSALEYHGFRSSADIPRAWVDGIAVKFADNRAAACDQALMWYGKVATGLGTGRGDKFLVYAPRNPFAD